MAKTKGPLLSLDAHGSLSKLLTYSNKRTGQQVRRYNKPLTTPSAAQRGQRRLTEFLVAQWQNMSDAQKATWETNAKASTKNLPGYQYFLREAQRDLYTHHGLGAYWSFNTIVSGKALDISGQGNHATLQPNYPSDAPTLIESRSIRFSKALDFNGSTQYLNLTAKQKYLHGDFTVFLWFDTDAKLARKMFTLPASSGAWDNAFSIEGSGSRGIQAYVFDNAGGSALLQANSGLIVINKWYMFAITHDNTSGANRIYIDANVQDDISSNVAPRDNDLRTYFIGANSAGTSNYDGKHDELCIYNRVFSPAEITTRYKFANVT